MGVSSGLSDGEESVTDSSPYLYSADELKAMTIAQIKALAVELGYSITKTLKADIIEEFLQQQNSIL